MHAQILDSDRDESVVDVLRGLCGAGIVIAFIDPTDGSRSDDLMVSDKKWRPMIDAVLYRFTCIYMYLQLSTGTILHGPS